MDLTLSRLWQIRDVALERQVEEHERQTVLAEAMVKQLVAHIRIAAGDRGANKAAAAVRLFERDKKKAKAAVSRGREIAAEQGQRLGAALGGGQPLEGLTEEMIQAAYR